MGHYEMNNANSPRFAGSFNSFVLGRLLRVWHERDIAQQIKYVSMISSECERMES